MYLSRSSQCSSFIVNIIVQLILLHQSIIDVNGDESMRFRGLITR